MSNSLTYSRSEKQVQQGQHSDSGDKLQKEQAGNLDEQRQKSQPNQPPLLNASRVPPEYPIEYWEERLIGKKLIDEDAEGDETVCQFPSTIISFTV